MGFSKKISNFTFYFLFSKFSIVFLFFIFYFLFSFPASAAEIFFGAHSLTVDQGNIVEVGVFVKTNESDINALEGKIVFPADYLVLQAISDSNSIISLWLKQPKADDSPAGEVNFSGIIPGGYSGDRGYLFSLIFKAVKAGEIKITSADEKILLNDGQGTADIISRAPLELKISTDFNSQEFIPLEDNQPPEEFKPEIASDPNLFNGRWFLVFATQDKGTGIDHYEIQENRKQKIENRSWQTAESPYALKDQKLRSFVYIKAIDKAGNGRIAVIRPKYPLKWYENDVIFVILIVIILSIIVVIWRKILWRKYRNRK